MQQLQIIIIINTSSLLFPLYFNILFLSILSYGRHGGITWTFETGAVFTKSLEKDFFVLPECRTPRRT